MLTRTHIHQPCVNFCNESTYIGLLCYFCSANSTETRQRWDAGRAGCGSGRRESRAPTSHSILFFGLGMQIHKIYIFVRSDSNSRTTKIARHERQKSTWSTKRKKKMRTRILKKTIPSDISNSKKVNSFLLYKASPCTIITTKKKFCVLWSLFFFCLYRGWPRIRDIYISHYRYDTLSTHKWHSLPLGTIHVSACPYCRSGDTRRDGVSTTYITVTLVQV